jgi:hypothetical protein
MTPSLTLERGAVDAGANPTSSGNSTSSTRPNSGGGTGSRTAQPEYFVVATHKVRDRSGGAPNRWLPYGAEHAWEPGTRRTLCGEWITGWTVFWDRRFSARPVAACAGCVEATLPEESRRRLDHFDTRRQPTRA